MSKMLFTPKGTPTYALDSYRPKTHRLSFAPEEAATRSKLFAKRKRESQMFATGQLASARDNSILRQLNPSGDKFDGNASQDMYSRTSGKYAGASANTNPRWSIAPQSKPLGSHHLGLPRKSEQVEAFGAHHDVHGGAPCPVPCLPL